AAGTGTTACSLGWVRRRASANCVDRVQDVPHRVRRVRCPFEQAALYIEGRRGPGAGSCRALRVNLDLLACLAPIQAGDQLPPVHAGALGNRNELAARLGDLGPIVLVLVQRIVPPPEPRPPPPPG